MGQKVTPVCFNSSYRQAFYDLVRTVVSKYDIDGMYFDSWFPFYFFRGGERICYCDGCKKGFKETTGMDIPYKENSDEFSSAELKIIDLYREWWKEELFEVFSETKRIVKSFKDIPLFTILIVLQELRMRTSVFYKAAMLSCMKEAGV